MALDEELDLPRPFGPYTLVRRLAVGGMAEVYVAKAKGLGGFEKLVAIKVIHPRYSEDDHFVHMLVEEAKISVLLNHVNIAQTFDLGCIEDTYYIVMEFIEGADAYRVMRKASEMKRSIPIELCVHIAAEMLNGLDYAHRKRDARGQPLGIVHRDISPQNVLLSYAGEVKIVDFGIAKAALRSAQTEAGVIKGKYYYMSPEQAWGDPMDHRSDIFSAGVVLYEMLTGRMLHSEDNVPLLLDKVRRAEIAPPERRRPSVPRALSAIVMKALQRDAPDRYQSAQEMSQALTQFLYAASPAFTAAGRLAELMGTLFPHEVQRHSAIVTLPSVEAPADRSGSRESLSLDSRESISRLLGSSESNHATRDDILPFRPHAGASATPRRITKLAAIEPAEGAPSPAWRAADVGAARDVVPEETTRPVPPSVADLALGRLTPAPMIESRDADHDADDETSDDASDPDDDGAEWDGPTSVVNDGWEDDETVVDPTGVAAAMRALRPPPAGVVRTASERGVVNVSRVPKKTPSRPGISMQDIHAAPGSADDVAAALPVVPEGEPSDTLFDELSEDGRELRASVRPERDIAPSGALEANAARPPRRALRLLAIVLIVALALAAWLAVTARAATMGAGARAEARSALRSIDVPAR